MSERPIISLLHPTMRVKPSEQCPRGWRDAHDAWLERADHPERIEYVLAVHKSLFPKAFQDVVGEDFAWHPFRLVQNFADRPDCPHGCVVDQLNAAAAASSGQLLIGVQDDLYPPEHWDTKILEAIERNAATAAGTLNRLFIDGQEVISMTLTAALGKELILVCSSGATPERDRELMICGAMTRKRYERYGFILDPEFESMFADNWYAHVARRDETAGSVKIIERLDIQFEHRHPIFTGDELDDAYKAQNRAEAYLDGSVTFKRKLGAKMITIGLPGQTFSSDYLFSWTKLYGHLLAVKGMLTSVLCIYTSNVHCTRMDFAKKVLESKHKPDYILTLDDDNTLSTEHYEMLQKDLDDDPTLDGVVGWCWCDPADAMGDKDDVPMGGTIPYCASCGVQKGWNPDRTENGEGIAARPFDTGYFEHHFRETGRFVIHSGDVFPNAFWSGFPVVMMRYETLKRLGPESFRPMLKSEVNFGFTSEDTSFFYHAHQAGLKFGVDMRVKVPHLKLRAIEVQYLPGVKREDVLKAQGKTLGQREEVPV